MVVFRSLPWQRGLSIAPLWNIRVHEVAAKPVQRGGDLMDRRALRKVRGTCRGVVLQDLLVDVVADFVGRELAALKVEGGLLEGLGGGLSGRVG